MPEFLFTPVPHNEAIDFIKSKPVVSREVFNELLDELKGMAFTIAGSIPADVQQSVRDLIATLPAGTPWDTIKSQIVGQISPYIVDPNASPEERIKQVRAAEAKAELLLRINGQQAYAAANYRVLQRNLATHPFWQYQTMGDSKVRASHRALNGIIVPASSPFWQTHFPPWEWGCRCIVIPRTEADADEQRIRNEADNFVGGRLIESSLLSELELSNRLVLGMNNIANVSPATGPGAWHWHPGEVRINVEDLRKRYDPAVFRAFEAWAKKTDVTLDPVKGTRPQTVWEWINRVPDALPGGISGEVPAAAASSGLPLPQPEPTPIERTERRIMGDRTESAHLFDSDGTVIFSKKGTRNEVRFTRTEVQRMKDMILTHNHPQGSAFSDSDIDIAIRADLAEIRAIGTNSEGRTFLYSLTRPEAGWSSLDQLRTILRSYRRISEEVFEEFSAEVHAGRMNLERARTEHYHEVMRRLAQQFPEVINYERTSV